MRLLITGGGTGGHLYPALAVAGLLKAKDPSGKILFIGTEEGLERRVVPREGYPFEAISAVKWPRRLNLQVFGALGSLFKGYRQGLEIIGRFRPHVVFATGGYVSVPLALAAARRGIPVYLHEQNAVPGMANKLLARWARVIFTTFPATKQLFPGHARLIHTGLPVRQAILEVRKEDGAGFFNLDPACPTLVVTGGSRGARAINRVMLQVYGMMQGDESLPPMQIIHLTGRAEYEEFCKQLESKGISEGKIGKLVMRPYLEEMEYALAAADLIVSRAGAATLAEIAVRGLPAILIPYPYAAGNHQYHNALALAEEQAAILIPEQELEPQRLYALIKQLIIEEPLRRDLSRRIRRFGRPEAGELITSELMKAGSLIL